MGAMTAPVPRAADKRRRDARGGGPDGLEVSPSDLPRGHGTGPDAYRLMLVAAERLAGDGVLSHELGLVGCFARSLAAGSGHGATIDLISGGRGTAQEAARLLAARSLEGLDGLTVLVQPGRAAEPVAEAAGELRRLLIDVATRLPPTSPITVVVAGRGSWPAAPLRTFLEAMREAAGPMARVMELPSPPADSSPHDRYRQWGGWLAREVGRSLRDPARWRAPFERVDETARQAAVDRLGWSEARWATEFADLVALARTAYRTPVAALALVDGSRTRFVARQGLKVAAGDREQTMAATVLKSHGGLVIADARSDERFRRREAVRRGIVFYAGYRIRSCDGQPLAAFGVADDRPRAITRHDVTMLRDFAHSVERRIWELTRPSPL